MSDLIPAIDREIAELEEAIRADPRQHKLKALKELRSLYTGTSTSEDVSAAAAPKTSLFDAYAKRARRRADPERVRLLEEVESLLKVLGPEPTKTADLYEMISASGHNIGGADPRNNLSAILFNSGRFMSHGRKGWTVRPEGADGEEEGIG